jgi:hypothetical protein
MPVNLPDLQTPQNDPPQGDSFKSWDTLRSQVGAANSILKTQDDEPGCLLVLLALLALLSAVYGFQRVGVALSSWDTLQELGMVPGPLYAVFSGLVWGLVSLGAVLGLVLRQGWGPGFTRAGMVFLASFYWVDRLWLTRSPVPQINEPFAAAATVAVAVYVFGVLALKKQRRFFKR